MIPGVIQNRGKAFVSNTLLHKPSDYRIIVSTRCWPVIWNTTCNFWSCISPKIRGFSWKIYMWRSAWLQRNSTLVSFHDRDFKYLGLVKATSGQYLISSLHLDKGWWTTRLSALLFLPSSNDGQSHLLDWTPSLRQYRSMQSSLVAKKKIGGGQRTKIKGTRLFFNK